MQQLFEFALVFVAAWAIAYPILWWRVRGMLRAWAEPRGMRLVSHRWLPWDLGPFLLWKGRDQMVWRVHIQNRHGEHMLGYACVGGYFTGLWFSNNVEIVWDRV